MLNIEKEREAFEQVYAVINGLSGSLIKSAFEKIGTEYVNLQTKRAFDLWLASALRAAEKLEGCVVVPKDQVETWWQDAEEPENFASTIESIPALGENLSDSEIMEIDEHHTIHLPSKRIYGTWFEKDGERSFLTGSLEECRAMVEAARGGNE